MNIKDRLLEYLKTKKISNRAFEIQCGLSNGYVKGLNDSIRPKTLGLITEQFPELNRNWLLTGEGDMIKTNLVKEENTQSVASDDTVTISKDFYELLISQNSILSTQQETILQQQRSLILTQETLKLSQEQLAEQQRVMIKYLPKN